jgi:hypothetical protein
MKINTRYQKTSSPTRQHRHPLTNRLDTQLTPTFSPDISYSTMTTVQRRRFNRLALPADIARTLKPQTRLSIMLGPIDESANPLYTAADREDIQGYLSVSTMCTHDTYP